LSVRSRIYKCSFCIYIIGLPADVQCLPADVQGLPADVQGLPFLELAFLLGIRKFSILSKCSNYLIWYACSFVCVVQGDSIVPVHTHALGSARDLCHKPTSNTCSYRCILTFESLCIWNNYFQLIFNIYTLLVLKRFVSRNSENASLLLLYPFIKVQNPEPYKELVHLGLIDCSPHGVTTRKTNIDMVTAVRTSNLISLCTFSVNISRIFPHCTGTCNFVLTLTSFYYSLHVNLDAELKLISSSKR
jgi:hypothetical protein